MEASAPSAEVSSAPVEAPTATAPVMDAPSTDEAIPRIGRTPEESLSKDTPPQPQADLLAGEAVDIQPEPDPQIPSGEPIQTLEKWSDALPDELKGNPNITKYASVEDALKANLNLVKKLGEKGVMRPDENADADTWNAWYDHVGRPQTADGYTDYEPPVMKDAEGNEMPSFEIDQDVYKEAKQVFYEAGLDDNQAQKVMELYANTSLNQMEAEVKYTAEQANHAKGLLESEWGAEMGARVKTAINVMDKLGIRETLTEKGLLNDVGIVRMLDSIAGKIGEAKLTGDVSPAGGGFEQQMSEIKNHPAYHDKSHPDYQTLHNRRIALYAKKYN